MEFKMDDLWRMVQIVGIPLFVWMERRTTKAQADAEWARSVSGQLQGTVSKCQADLDRMRGEHSTVNVQMLSKMESLAVSIARLDGRLISVLEVEKERRTADV